MAGKESNITSGIQSITTDKRKSKLSGLRPLLWIAGVCLSMCTINNIFGALSDFTWLLFFSGVLFGLIYASVGLFMYIKNPKHLVSEEHIEEMNRYTETSTNITKHKEGQKFVKESNST